MDLVCVDGKVLLRLTNEGDRAGVVETMSPSGSIGNGALIVRIGCEFGLII